MGTKTCFIFGDSFSSGYMLTNNISPLYPKQNREYWTKKVSKELKCDKLIDYSEAGSSNEQILFKISQHFEEIKSKDVVIIGTTYPIRSLMFGQKYAKESEVYQSTVKLPDFFKWENYYNSIFNMIQSFLDYKKIRTIIWSYDLHYGFENIGTATNYKIKDGHWSWEGNDDFANFFIKNLNSKFIDKSFIKVGKLI